MQKDRITTLIFDATTSGEEFAQDVDARYHLRNIQNMEDTLMRREGSAEAIFKVEAENNQNLFDTK